MVSCGQVILTSRIQDFQRQVLGHTHQKFQCNARKSQNRAAKLRLVCSSFSPLLVGYFLLPHAVFSPPTLGLFHYYRAETLPFLSV